MKKWIKRILAALLILVLVCVLAFCGLYLGRFKTLASIRKVSAYEDGYNLYRMDIKSVSYTHLTLPTILRV